MTQPRWYICHKINSQSSSLYTIFWPFLGALALALYWAVPISLPTSHLRS